ncbi:hypothetical protein HanXRQr2_Chr17g0826551 [Helianthus annuus]|uniref:Uncharacterized protein n=1 Tax=Helianthus annuus TaxID=4232 RepID=A0A9K3DNM9_HELAN|nr:hypothetical protein HanXRQr2_Chr17g0826551 [Helianthus annuus]KAJ0815082.1 hypothetical protein HanPSC8_Chr17g0793351 [Helianthus annuus]
MTIYTNNKYPLNISAKKLTLLTRHDQKSTQSFYNGSTEHCLTTYW